MTSIATRIRTLPSWQVTLSVALLALGFLIAAQLRAEGPLVRYTTQERSPLVETARGLQGDQERLKQQIADLSEQIRTLQQQGIGSSQLADDLDRQLEQVRVAAGLVALEGTGIVLQLTDSTAPPPQGANRADYVVSGRDIRTVVEELWLAGAEAIAVNGERLTASSGITDIGGTILVNSAYLAPPYQVSAIGPSDLFDRLGRSQGFIDFVRARSEAFGIGVSVATPSKVVVPGYLGTVNLRYSRPADATGGGG
ncbi:MAG TPA: DUF881 domain-containing protein [Candidatus Dormibacteraeota bacterium]|nr:DUF881 domain-containing protein [Candidatus Dormibacteraeota bacterium]